MDMLKSEQERLCLWLKDDPDYILDQCGAILLMNDFKEVQKQNSALEKMRLLLKIIIQKGGDTCQSFVDILRQHQAHYRQLQQFFNPHTPGSPSPTVVADNSSVVSNRQITNTTAKFISFKTEIVSDPGSHSCGNVAPQADYTALGGSLICADKISGVTSTDGIEFSVSMKPSQVHAGAVEDTLPSPQGPAVKMIIEHKVELIDTLRADLFILQKVHAKRIVEDREYQHLKNISPPEKTVIELIDKVIRKGQEKCVQFLQVLKDPEVLSTYPQLEEILKNMEA